MKQNKRVKTKTVYQMEMTECGAATLGMILLYYGCYVPLEQLRIDTGVTRDGCNAYNILLGAQTYGLKGKGIKTTAKNLRSKTFPCIIYWKSNHFVILEGFSGKYAFINDPAQGRRRIPYEIFEECFSDRALFFEPADSFQKKKKQTSVFHALLERASEQRAGLAALILFGCLLLLPGILIPALSRIFVDNILNAGQMRYAKTVALVFVFALFFQTGLGLYRNFIRERMSRKLSVLSSRNLTEHILKLPVSFFEQRYLGDVMKRNESNDKVNDFLINDLCALSLDLLSAVIYFIILIKQSVLLTLTGLLGITADILISSLRMNTLAALTEKQATDGGRLSGMLISGLSISRTLKASGAENDFAERIAGQEARITATELETNRVQGFIDALSGVVLCVLDVLMLLAGAYLVMQGQLTSGALVAFISLFKMLSDPVNTLVNFTRKIQMMQADLNRVEDVERHEVAHTFKKDSESLVRFSGKLSGQTEVRNLTFGYSRLDEPMLRDISFDILPGKTIALVGSSGSGKSTLGKLLSGMYLPWEGDILFDGISGQKIPSNVINASIATVSQNIVLFGGTIRDNLTMWNKNILEEDMIRAAKDACIHDTIMRKNGAYEYVLSENGENFSGGQRQRLEIARALAVNPSLLIMDEATSALDPVTEKEIIDNIKRRGITCVIVAHRLSAIRDCDEILVMQDGSVIQRGSHEKLMAEEGYYKELIKNI